MFRLENRKTVEEILQTMSRQYFRVAHASRGLTPVRLGLSASRRNNLFLQKSAIARTQSPTRGTGALPGTGFVGRLPTNAGKLPALTN
ncbi:MAG: hypothetical protein DMF19_01945 [Verrucomicrobia bacterium]|nr:MAG: hypothetical protein DMF19_01945 [Verrucomicrobiota bacterium]